MTLPGSGSLSYNSIRAEFGSPSSNVYLSLYYRGGPYTYAIPQNANITTSSTGTISVNNFYGTVGKGPFLQFSGGTHNTGGKSPVVYYGAGGPSLPGIGDPTITIGGQGYTVNRFYGTATGSSSPVIITGAPTSNLTSAPTWSPRNFYCYNSGGGLAGQFRTGYAAGRGLRSNFFASNVAQQPRVANTPGGAQWVYESGVSYPGDSTLGNFVSDASLSVGPPQNSAPTASPAQNPVWVSGNPSILNQYIVIKAN